MSFEIHVPLPIIYLNNLHDYTPISSEFIQITAPNGNAHGRKLVRALSYPYSDSVLAILEAMENGCRGACAPFNASNDIVLRNPIGPHACHINFNGLRANFLNCKW